MVATFFLDWGLSFAAGMLFALAGRRAIAADPPGFSTRAFRYGFAYLQLGVLGVAVALYVRMPDWMWMYWVSPLRVPVAVVVLAFAMYEVAFIAGFVLAPALERARRGTGVAALLGVGTLLAVAQFATRERLMNLGTIEDFDRGALLTWGEDAANGRFLAIALAASVVALVLTALRVARSARDSLA